MSQGASQQAIQSHYDVGNDFYALWLDSSLTYSCALWGGDDDTLEDAQKRKLEYHARSAKARGVRRALDIGCGWGSMLRWLVEQEGVERAVGLTLSEAQAKHVDGFGDSRIVAAVEDWRFHSPDGPYDSIISIGALEHFVRPEDSVGDRIATYREFFSQCRRWLRPSGQVSLQTIAYAQGSFVRGAIASIFPESDLPRLPELASAFEGVFELTSLRGDRLDYARTCRAWLERLRRNRDEAVRTAGEARVRHFESFLAASAKGFDLGIFTLFRLTLAPLPSRS